MIVVIERSLDVVNGHEHTQIKAIKGLAPDRDILVATHHEFDAPAVPVDGPIRTILSTQTEAAHHPAEALARDIDAICDLVESENTGASISFVVPSAYPHEIRTGLAVLRRVGNRARFAFRVIRPEAVSALESSEVAEVAEAIGRGSISLHTEVQELTEWLMREYDLLAEDNFLLPCTVDPLDQPTKVGAVNGSGRVRVGYLGNYRTEKGSESIPAILDALARRLATSPRTVRVEFIAQFPTRVRRKPRKLTYVLKVAQVVMKHVPGRRLRVRWYQGGASPEKFLSLLRSLDVVLVPYHTDAYRYRGSGIVIDSALACRPLVVSEGIGMQRHTAFGNATFARDTEGFAQGIMDMIAKRGTISEELDAARQDVLKQLDRTRAFLASLG